MTVDYVAGAVAIGFGLLFSLLFLGLALFLGPKRVSGAKLEPFECGSEPIGSPRVRFSVKFYHVAILFLIFDVEAVFLYPLVVVFRQYLSWIVFLELVLFLSTLGVAYLYLWRKRMIGWG